MALIHDGVRGQLLGNVLPFQQLSHRFEAFVLELQFDVVLEVLADLGVIQGLFEDLQPLCDTALGLEHVGLFD